MPHPRHPATLPTPAQLAVVHALRARLISGLASAPCWPHARAEMMIRKLDAYADADRSLLRLFLSDWQEGIEFECRSLELAAGRKLELAA